MSSKMIDIKDVIASVNADSKLREVLHLADNSLLMGHRLSEWTGHGPMLEQDIAISNIALDLIGQSRNFYQYAATLLDNGATEDTLAYFREAHEFRNFILVELPNGDWGKTILKLFLFSVYQSLLYTKMLNEEDTELAGIAEKSLKEVSYHLRWSSEWVIRLGDGTDESRQRMQNALNEIWSYTTEFFIKHRDLQSQWTDKVSSTLQEATLDVPALNKIDLSSHTEHLSKLLAEMQILQRTYPGCEW